MCGLYFRRLWTDRTESVALKVKLTSRSSTDLLYTLWNKCYLISAFKTVLFSPHISSIVQHERLCARVAYVCACGFLVFAEVSGKLKRTLTLLHPLCGTETQSKRSRRSFPCPLPRTFCTYFTWVPELFTGSHL